MKTKYLWTAITVLVLAGCSQNEILNMSPEANPAVEFSVYAGTQTKGLVTDNGNPGATDTKALKDAGFGILAAYTGQADWSNTAPNFMYNQQVEWKTSAWSYTPLKYWPKTENDQLSFWAYAPYDDATNDQGIELSANTVTTVPTLTFTLKETDTAEKAAKMVDLVAGCVMNQKKINTVSFTLKHVLSRVIFHAKASEELLNNADDAKKTHIFITKAELLGEEIFTKATYKFNTNSSVPNDAWAYDGATNAGASGKDITGILKLKTDNSIGSGTQYTTSAVDLTSATAGSIFADNQYLFLIPAGASGIQAPAKAQVKFTYDIVTEDSKLGNGYSKTTSTATANLTASTLQKGVAYKYTFTFGVNAIKVSAEIDTNGWGSESGSEITPNL